jgi:hypothetical protein
MLFVAMPTPRKELFVGRWGEQLNVAFSMGVGGSIGIVAGITRRARASSSASAWSGHSASPKSRAHSCAAM